MSKLSRILAPIDFVQSGSQDLAHAALTHAKATAARTGAELHVLHVQVLNPNLRGWNAVPNVEGIEKAINELSERDLNEAIRDVSQPVIHEIARGFKEAPVILDYAEAHKIDLIVMGTHARKGVSRMFLGSVTAEVLRYSPVSVLAIGPEHTLSSDNYRRVLAPVDFSDSSSAALQQASAIAKQHDAELTVIHVVEPPRLMAPYNRLDQSTEKELHDHAAKALDELLAKVELTHAPQQKVVVTGEPDEAIVSYARKQSTDLIVMGHVGLSGLNRLFLGSTTERVLRQIPCAVLAHRVGVLDNL